MQQSEKVNSSVANIAEQEKCRFSGIELLKIIAIFLICISHAAQTVERFIDFWAPTKNISYLILQTMRCFGQIGNVIFIICSSWFLLDSKKTKAEKAIRLLLDSAIISFLIMIGFVIGGEKLTKRTIFEQIFPDIYKNNWFIPIYVIFYCVHGLLNSAIEKMTIKSHLAFCIFSYVLFGILGGLCVSPDYSQLIGFFIIYFSVAFIKKHCGKLIDSVRINFMGFILFFVLFLAEILLNNFLQFNTRQRLEVNYLLSPVFLPMLLCLFNLFRMLKFKSGIINYISSCSLFIYCIHENILLREKIRPRFFQYVFEHFGYNTVVLWSFLCGLGMLIGAFLLSCIYKSTIHRFTHFISVKIKNFLNKALDKTVGLFLKEN